MTRAQYSIVAAMLLTAAAISALAGAFGLALPCAFLGGICIERA